MSAFFEYSTLGILMVKEEDSVAERKSPRVAIVHDWLVNYGGAERVLELLHRIFPEAPIYTLVYHAKHLSPHFDDCDIRTTYMQHIPGAHKLYKNFLTLMPGAFERLDLSEFDIVISACSACCKGVITRADAVHICYCHTPIRYVWSHFHEYRAHANWFKRLLIPFLIPKIRLWDFQAAQRVDLFLANSQTTAQRIRKYYRREAQVVYPGVHMEPKPAVEKEEEYYLIVGRFIYYKRFDLAVQACTRLKRRLIVVGCGDEEKALHAMAGDTITFTGRISDEEMHELYRSAKAFLFPGEEDFGITPVEAQTAGCPVIAYGRGGATESVIDQKTGVFFHEQTVEALENAILQFEECGVDYSRSQIQQSALRFSEEVFCQKVQQIAQEAWRSTNLLEASK